MVGRLRKDKDKFHIVHFMYFLMTPYPEVSNHKIFSKNIWKYSQHSVKLVKKMHENTEI